MPPRSSAPSPLHRHSLSVNLLPSSTLRDFPPPTCGLPMFGPSVSTEHLLWPLLTSGDPSRHLSMSVAQGTSPDLPGYCALTFPLMPVGSTPRRSVQVSGFACICLLTPTRRLLSASCSSGQRFAYSFLQIPSRPGHPCRSANSSPCRVSRGLTPPSECALPGAKQKRAGTLPPSPRTKFGEQQSANRRAHSRICRDSPGKLLGNLCTGARFRDDAREVPPGWGVRRG